MLQIVMDNNWEGASRTSIMFESYLSLLIEKWYSKEIIESGFLINC